jgi:hypothetical protein
MFISYRRTGGVFALLTFAAVALAATALAIVVAATVLVAALVLAATAFVARGALSGRWRRHTVPPVSRWPHATIDTTAVNPPRSSAERDLVRLDGDKE